MIRMVLPVLLALLGTGGGVAAGLWFAPPAPDSPVAATGDGVAPPDVGTGGDTTRGTEFVKLNNQFLVPIVMQDTIRSMVVMSLNVEITEGAAQQVYAREPKLRDAFLQVLFDHANMGGFEGEFTSSGTMDALRAALTEVAQRVLGDVAHGVLITGIARQDV
ncbi:flagellar basal body-associated FliL family protein [Roseovarius tibetensis]|uniref:flagellar basal body-associated FliL family protein n=1 Tax=Roseovarius tibetensis TaxID=2685897 RepID=UPI003D7F1A9C